MAPPQKPGPAAVAASDSLDLLALLQARRIITPEQAERARRSAKMNNLTADQAAIQLGLVNEIQIAQALAAQAGLKYVKLKRR